MKLEDLCNLFETQKFPKLGEKMHPERDSVMAARAEITKAITDEQFLIECISCELNRLRGNQSYKGLAPFYEVPDFGIRFAFGYWQPGGTPGPHEHTAWTITSLFRNTLDILTYNYEESYRQKKLVPKNRFHATAGQVGFIYEPCIHKPINLSRKWSLSLHVTSPLDGASASCPTPLPDLITREKSIEKASHPYTQVVKSRYRQKFVFQMAQTLTSMKNSRVPEILRECAEIASTPTRKLINKITRNSDKADESKGSRFLEKTHKNLILDCIATDRKIALYAETPDGMVEQLAFTPYARETVQFIAKHSVFEVRDLPGNLTEAEKIALADLLEETGLFKSS